MKEDIKQVLRDILAYVGADSKYVEYAQLQSWLENLIKRNKEEVS